MSRSTNYFFKVSVYQSSKSQFFQKVGGFKKSYFYNINHPFLMLGMAPLKGYTVFV